MMKRKNIISCVALAALAVIGGTMAMTMAANGGLKAFASIESKWNNPYRGECSAEYYVSDVYARLQANPDLSGTENVRIIAKVSNIANWFQDVDSAFTLSSKSGSIYVEQRCIVESSTTVGYSKKDFQANETVAFFGTVCLKNRGYSHETKTVDTLVVYNATFYRWGEQVNYDLLPEAIYLDF